VSAAAYFLAIPCFLMLTKTGLRTKGSLNAPTLP
jgi:hypothetical protein